MDYWPSIEKILIERGGTLMFGFFKKKEQPKIVKEEISLSEEAQAIVREEIEQLRQIIVKENQTDVEKLATLYEELGLKQAELNEVAEAIKSLESSLRFKKTIGNGYKKLMSLYNKKRAESARNGDNQGIDYYMGKMDEMRQIAKQVTINGK